VVSRDILLAEVWGHPQDIATRTVDNFIVRLRKKIEPDPTHPRATSSPFMAAATS
jgi:DNA-binding response OmpR family regulator